MATRDRHVSEHRRLNPILRAALAVVGMANIVLAVAFAFQASWALELLPWETGRLSYIFIGSIFAAIGAGVLWAVVSQELGSLPSGFGNLTVALGGSAAYLLPTAIGEGRDELLPFAVAVAILAVGNLVLFLTTLRLGEESPPLPWLVRGSYFGFTAILLAVSAAMITRTEGVMPWPVDADTSVFIGWIFAGNACAFLYGAVRGRWDSARAQLWGFLAYDVVLIVPLLLHYADAPADLRTNIVVYAAVLAYSGALAVYYLLINPSTRGWVRIGGEPQTAMPPT